MGIESQVKCGSISVYALDQDNWFNWWLVPDLVSAERLYLRLVWAGKKAVQIKGYWETPVSVFPKWDDLDELFAI